MASEKTTTPGDSQSNSHREASERGENERGRSHPRSRLNSAIETFTPIWYPLSMNTGILSILLHQLPYNASWMRICATILFVFNICLFSTITLILVIRAIRFPRTTLKGLQNPNELCFWACAPIALATIIGQLGLTVSQASWGGHAFTIVAYVFWWFAATWQFLMALIIYTILTKTTAFKETPVIAPIFLPAVGVATLAVIGGNIVLYSHNMSPRMAVPVIIWSYMLNGIGAFLAFCVYALFLQRLFVHGLPDPLQLPSLVLLVGPMGQCAAALIALGSAARRDFGPYDKGMILTMMSGEGFNAASVMLALLFLGLDVFFLFFALYALVDATFKRTNTFSLVWWSTIFPISTLNLSCVELSEVLNSPAFRAIAVLIYICLFVDYLGCWAFTLRDIWKGKLLDGRVKDE